MASNDWKFVVWERINKVGKWCPYPPEVSQLLEQSLMKNTETVPLGDADENLKIYTVHLNDLIQVSANTGTKSKVRRRLCDGTDIFCTGITWQWKDDHDSWHIYDVDVNSAIEKAFQEGLNSVTLNKTFRGYHFVIDFQKMIQINKQTKRKRRIQRIHNPSPYPVTRNPSDLADQNIAPTCPPAADDTPTAPPLDRGKIDFSDLAKEVPGTTALEQQANNYIENVRRTYAGNTSDSSTVNEEESEEMNTDNDDQDSNVSQTVNENLSSVIPSNTNQTVQYALVKGCPWYASRPPHTHQSHIKPVPGIDPLPTSTKKPVRKRKKMCKVVPETNSMSVLQEYTSNIEKDSLISSEEDQVCIICYESLQNGSSYDDDETLLQLKLCLHVFHKSCLVAMYNSGPKDNCLQCPLCKKIHGEKCGIQPPGKMIYHVLPYSLPGYYECDTIRIIYDIPSGIQGPEHPNPGKRYTSRGFPRHCFLPDNEMGRKILRLLIKAWNRKLIFTIGRSSTTGEEDTVTWNEIHHKTEFGFSKRGHGYPDPNYFDNVLGELEAHGIKDDEVYLWFPA